MGLETDKLIQILRAWLEYIRWEEMTSAEVEKGWGSLQRVFDSGVRLAGNKLLLQKALFGRLRQQYLSLKQRGQEREFQIAVAAPQIYWVQGKGKEQKLKYLPLFAIDVASIFQRNYRQAGWDLTGYDFQPVMVNLMRLYRLEEEEAESLLVSEGIFRFLKDAFRQKFPTLQAFINQIDLPDNYKADRSLYLVRYNFVPYNSQLKQDLREILRQLLSDPDGCSWFKEGHPALQYLCGSPVPPRHEVMFWGAFPTHAPDEFQAQVLKQAQENRLTALWGAPGTGKTETAQHLVAQQIVKRVRHYLSTGRDENHLVVFASTNNSALQKFQSRLRQPGIPAQLYLSGGNQSRIESQTLPQLLAKIAQLRATEFDIHAYEQTKQAFLQVEGQLQQLIDAEPGNQRQRDREVQTLEGLEGEILTVSDLIASTSQELQALQQKLSNEPDYSDFLLEDYRKIQELLEAAWDSLPGDTDTLLQRWFNRLRPSGVQMR